MAGNNGYNAIELSWDDSCKDVECVATATCFIFLLCTKGDWDGAFGAVFECMKRHAMPLVATYFARGD